MSKPVIRTYKDSNDLKRMQKLTQAIWPLEPNYHIGDLAWQRYRLSNAALCTATRFFKSSEPLIWRPLNLSGN